MTQERPLPDGLNQEQVRQALDYVIASRRSVRAFLDTLPPRALIEEILQIAARAPSGTNTQPWRVHVLTGESRAKLSRDILAAYDDPQRQEIEEYPYYPRQWVAPYIERRRKVGWDLYALLGLTRDNKAGMKQQHGRNYQFFDAPVALFFTIEPVMERGSWLDYGMFLQNIMLAARARGLDTCPQAAFIHYPDIIKQHLGIDPAEILICGMSMGYADMSKVENSLVTQREPVATFARFHE
ncbi:nitroreductase [Massilia sp. W12]|uniref:nitroreductase n=1 Tax=Massilia sp. W12 TaxID=3126507 RepID=UPI0030D1ECA1